MTRSHENQELRFNYGAWRRAVKLLKTLCFKNILTSEKSHAEQGSLYLFYYETVQLIMEICDKVFGFMGRTTQEAHISHERRMCI